MTDLHVSDLFAGYQFHKYLQGFEDKGYTVGSILIISFFERSGHAIGSRFDGCSITNILLFQNGDIDRVQKALNHSNKAVTLVYAMADKEPEAKNVRRRAMTGAGASGQHRGSLRQLASCQNNIP